MEYVEVQLEFLPTTEGGRSESVNLTQGRYRSHFVVAGENEYLGVAFQKGPEAVRPGDEVTALAALVYANADYSALVEGARFDVREGSITVASGCVLRRLETLG